MESGQEVRRRRVGAFRIVVAVAAVLTALTAIVSPGPAQAVPIGPGSSIGDFEIDADANFAVDAAGKVDWEGTDLAQHLFFDDDLRDPDPDGTGDEGYVGGAKEMDRSTWGCSDDAGKTPQKDNVFYTLAYPALSLDEAEVSFAYVRDKGEGDTNVSIELNQNSLDACSTVNDRTPGDLLLHFNFPGGSGSAAIEAFVWSGTAFDELDLVDDAADPDDDYLASLVVAAASNNKTALTAPVEIADELAGAGASTAIGARQFGEAAIDLYALQSALQQDPDVSDQIDDVLDCPGIGFANIRTRSSESGDSSQLHDIVPQIPIDLSDCAQILIKKVDDSSTPVAKAGAVYGLYDSLAKAQAVVDGQSDDDAKAAATSWCETGADGTCSLFDVDPDQDYWITEISPPDGLLPSAEIRPVDADDTESFEHVDLTGTPFVNEVPVANVTIEKRLFDDANENGVLDEGEEVTPADMADLDGITFELQQSGTTATTHPAGDDAACTISGGTAACTISSVPLGTYDIAETLAPDGPSGIGVGPPPSVTVDEDGETVTATYDNPVTPLSITVVKDGPALAHRGDEITYTFDVTNSGGADLVDVELTDPICDEGTLALIDDADGDTTLAIGETWAYECTRVILDDDPDPLPNTATAVGTDVLGRTTDDADDHEVDIIQPAIEIVKTVDDDTPAVDQTVTFTYVVTNSGDTTLFGVDVDDDKLGPIGTIDELAAGDSATLTKTMVVATDSPPRNVATADGEDILGEHVVDDDDAIITVVQGVVIVAPELPRTGSDIERLLTVAAALVLLGGVALASGRPALARARARRGPQQ
jgi:uncharacterized repeat protein (TIGR01451 family)